MNTVITSKENILEAAKDMILAGKENSLNMRAVAKNCDIAVGSIYNYFPTKADLVIAVIAEIWKEIFHSFSIEETKDDFLILVEDIADSIRRGKEIYPGFFRKHASYIEDKGKGSSVMDAYFKHIEEALYHTLLNDKKIRKDIWKDDFTAKDFASFVFRCLRTDFMQEQDNSEFLKQLIVRIVY